MPRGQPHRRTSMEPTSRTRRMLIKAGIAGFATPAVAAAAQSAKTSREGARFKRWVISDRHVGTDKAASAGKAARRGGARRDRHHRRPPYAAGNDGRVWRL